MQYEINIANVQREAAEIQNMSRRINERLWRISGIYVGLRLIGDPAIQIVVAHILRQNAALAVESQRLASMGRKLNKIARYYYTADNKVVNSFHIRGSVIDAYGHARRHNAENSEMDDFIRDYERSHPRARKDLDSILRSGNNNVLTEEDIRKIKYLAYTAEEPFRSIYLRYLRDYMIGDGNMKEGAYYDPNNKTINFTYKDCFKNDPRGEYTTFFHESGHGVDDVADLVRRNGSDTDAFKTHSDAMGKDVTIREAIEYDVYYNKNNPHSVTSLAQDIIIKGKSGSRGNIDNVIKAFKSGSSDGLSKEDLKLYNAVRNAHLREVKSHPSTEMEAVTDVYGGISKNALQTDKSGRHGYTHDDDYWKNQSQTNHELWAEYFSYNMAGNTEALNNLREYFPEAAKAMDAYAQSLADR